MPELPEVETIVEQLKARVKGKTISSIEILDQKMIDSQLKNIVPIKIVDIFRRAKSIIFELEKKYLLVHLRMTGHFHYLEKEGSLGELEKFVVAKFHLADGSLLTHNSIRRFGSIKMLTKKELDYELSKLGIEPLSKDFTFEKLREMLKQKKNSTIKTLLMEQSFISGLGNIYAQEALYHARIKIDRKAGSLSAEEIAKLREKIIHVLKLAIKHHGTTVENYVHIEGSGGFQRYLAVYGKHYCPKKHLLKKVTLGGRGTSYCPVCQR